MQTHCCQCNEKFDEMEIVYKCTRCNDCRCGYCGDYLCFNVCPVCSTPLEEFELGDSGSGEATDGEVIFSSDTNNSPSDEPSESLIDFIMDGEAGDSRDIGSRDTTRSISLALTDRDSLNEFIYQENVTSQSSSVNVDVEANSIEMNENVISGNDIAIGELDFNFLLSENENDSFELLMESDGSDPLPGDISPIISESSNNSNNPLTTTTNNTNNPNDEPNVETLEKGLETMPTLNRTFNDNNNTINGINNNNTFNETSDYALPPRLSRSASQTQRSSPQRGNENGNNNGIRNSTGINGTGGHGHYLSPNVNVESPKYNQKRQNSIIHTLLTDGNGLSNGIGANNMRLVIDENKEMEDLQNSNIIENNNNNNSMNNNNNLRIHGISTCYSQLNTSFLGCDDNSLENVNGILNFNTLAQGSETPLKFINNNTTNEKNNLYNNIKNKKSSLSVSNIKKTRRSELRESPMMKVTVPYTKNNKHKGLFANKSKDENHEFHKTNGGLNMNCVPRRSLRLAKKTSKINYKE